MVRVELFQTNSKCTFIILFGLLQVTQVAVNITKVIVARCHIKMVRVELFQINSFSEGYCKLTW